MPDFRLQFSIPDPIPATATSTFYWTGSGPSSFSSTYGPRLGGLGAVTRPNVDLVRIAAAVYAADRTTLRRARGSNWNAREIGISVPVNSPAAWKGVSDDLESLLGLLTGDHWRLAFTGARAPKETVKPAEVQAERVVLLSGGADSALGVLLSRRTVGDGGHVLLSHVGATNLAPIQREVAAQAELLVPGSTQEHMQIGFRRRTTQVDGSIFPSEPSSRSRSLLFLAYGLAVASRHGVPLWIPENGFASLNPPLGPERRGSLSTRTTHPAFLDGLATILGEVGAQREIVNPFLSKTKGEMFSEAADELGKAKASRFLSLTHSCGLTGQRNFGVPVATQCGVCFGCVVRKASFKASRVKDRTTYIVAPSGSDLETWLRSKSIEPSVRSFVRRGIRSRDIAAMGLPVGYAAADALDLCNRGVSELRKLYQ